MNRRAFGRLFGATFGMTALGHPHPIFTDPSVAERVAELWRLRDYYRAAQFEAIALAARAPLMIIDDDSVYSGLGMAPTQRTAELDSLT